MIEKIKEQWFLLGLVLVSGAVAFDCSGTLVKIGTILKNNYGPEAIVFSIFITSGLLINTDQIKAGIKDIGATVLALSLILIAAPITAWLLCLLPLETGVCIGLFIVAAMPTTLSSGVVMTGKAGGSTAHALFVTIISNFIAVFSIPVVLSMLLSLENLEKKLVIDHVSIIIKLSFLVLVPLFIGLGLKKMVLKNRSFDKFKLQIINQSMIMLIVFICLASAKQILSGQSTVFIYILLLVAVFHIILLTLSFFLVKFFGIKKGRCESIIFMGSQKTLPLSMMIQVTYFGEFGTALVVCVLHHIVHLMIDGYLSAKMSRGFFAGNK